MNYFLYQVNTVGYLFVSWILYFCTLKIQNYILKFYLIFTALVFYAFISWYAFFFTILLAITFLLVSIFDIDFRDNVQKNYISIKKSFKLVEGSLFILINGVFIFIFIYIYFPVKDAPNRSIEELTYGSLKIFNLFSLLPSQLTNIFFKDNFSRVDIKQYGLNIILIISIVIILLIGNWTLKQILFELKILFSSLITLLYFIDFGSNLMIHKYLYLNVPGFNSIRYTHRFVIFLSQILIIVLFLILDKKYLNLKKLEKILIYFLLLPILILSQIHPQWTGWKKEILANTDLISQASDVKSKCDYFYFDPPGGWWYDQIEAMYFAYEVGVPTVNGYSGGFPKGYPQLNFNEMNESQQIFKWISRINKKQRGCYLTGKVPLYELNSSLIRINDVGFKKTSKVEYLAISPYPYFYIFSELKKKYTINFKIRNNLCNYQNILSYKLGENSEYRKLKLNQNEQEISINLNANNNRVHRILFSSNSNKCLKDKKENYFYLSEVRIKSLSN